MPIPSGTVTFLFTDIEGSTRLAREHAETWEKLCLRHHEILRRAIEIHSGYIFQIVGDAFCAAFHNAMDALNAAVEAQQGLQNEPWGETTVRVRMGIHTGEAESDGSEYRGYLTLSLAQRLMSAGSGGQVLVSGVTENLLRGRLPGQLHLLDLGRHLFKDVPQPTRVFQVSAPHLPAEFPPIRTTDHHSHNLPDQLTSFVGRAKELAEIKQLLQRAHLLTLIGPGGTGKTRLSIQAAGEMLEQYPEGVWLVELAPIVDPLLVPRVSALALGLRDEPQRPIVDMLCDFLREKKMLILLDNCEHLVEACARLADRILHAAREVRILASSRESLGISGEVTYRVPSLGLPDLSRLPPVDTLGQYEAVKLFIERARSADPDFHVTNDNAPHLAEICYRLDGIPLAVELAAAKIRVLSPEQIARRLDDRFKLLTGGSRTSLERHQTLRAAIDWSYNLLPAEEQEFFRRLSVFVGGWTLEAAEYVCSNDPDRGGEPLELLEHLIQKSLVLAEQEHGSYRYRMLETIRQYASEKLVDSGKVSLLRDRHLDYYLDLARTAEPYIIGPDQLDWLARLDADYENLRRAFEWSLTGEDNDPSLSFCSALLWFWIIRCTWLEGLNWTRKALARPFQNENRNGQTARARALYTQAFLEWQLGNFEPALSLARASLALAAEDSDKKDIAIARYIIGAVTRLLAAEDEPGLSLMAQCVAEFEELGDSIWLSFSYQVLSSYSSVDTRDRYLKQLELARRAGDRLTLGDALMGYADWLYRHGQVEEACRHAEEAETLYRLLGSLNVSVSPFLFADIAWESGDLQKARLLFLEHQRRFNLLGEKIWNTLSTINLGRLAMDDGDLPQAKEYLEQALKVLLEINFRSLIAHCLIELGNLCYLQGDTRGFKDRFREGLALRDHFEAFHKGSTLANIMGSLYRQKPEAAAQLMGVVDRYEQETGSHLRRVDKRFWPQAEAHSRVSLGDAAFESAFEGGKKLSLDEALDLAWKAVEEME